MNKQRRICLVFILTAATWALWPLATSDHVDAVRGTNADVVQSPPPPPTRTSGELDRVAFQTPLWVTPPLPPSPPPELPPPPPAQPLRLQLLAIIKNVDGAGEVGTPFGSNARPNAPQQFSAMFFDPDANKVIVLNEGDTLPSAGASGSGGRSGVGANFVARVTEFDVQIREPAVNGRPAAVSTLTIRPKGGGG